MFLVLHRAGTFAGAGRALGVNPTTVARRLTALEQAVGAQIFTRTKDGLIPTAAAEEMFAASEIMERQAQRIERAVSGADQRLAGRVRLNTTQTTATYFLIEHLGAFHRRYPRIELEMSTDDSVIDMTRGDTDVAIRHRRAGTGPGVDGTGPIDVIARRVSPVGVAVYGSNAYLEAAGRPPSVHEVEGHHAILPRQDMMYLPGSDWARAVESKVHVALRCSTPSAMQVACSAGVGLAALLCGATLHTDNLMQLSDVIDSRETWLLMPADLRRVARVRALFDFLIELFDQWGPLWSGEVIPPGRDARPAE